MDRLHDFAIMNITTMNVDLSRYILKCNKIENIVI